MKPDLQQLALNIFRLASVSRVELAPAWIPREENFVADRLSRIQDCDDWQITKGLFRYLNGKHGPYTVDLFASFCSSKVPENFYSRFWCPNSAGVDAFTYSWDTDICWAVPPPRLVIKTLRHFAALGFKMTLVVPYWPSAPYWPFLCNFHRTGTIRLTACEIFENAQRFVIPTDSSAVWHTEHYTFRLLAVTLERCGALYPLVGSTQCQPVRGLVTERAPANTR